MDRLCGPHARTCESDPRSLRRDFAQLGIVVERVSPALDVDGVEAELLVEADPAAAFRILVGTPEKIDLLLRGGWEAKIGRPLLRWWSSTRRIIFPAVIVA